MLAVALVAVGVYLELSSVKALQSIALGFSNAREFQGSSLFLACLATKNATLGELLRWAGIYLLVAVIAYWRGLSRTTLVLKLVQRLEANSAPGANGGPA